jgi:hypothetical protein
MLPAARIFGRGLSRRNPPTTVYSAVVGGAGSRGRDAEQVAGVQCVAVLQGMGRGPTKTVCSSHDHRRSPTARATGERGYRFDWVAPPIEQRSTAMQYCITQACRRAP